MKKFKEIWQPWCSGYHYCNELSLNSGSAQAQTLLAACQWFAMVRISDNVPAWKKQNAFRRSTIPQKQFIILIIIIIIIIIKNIAKSFFPHKTACMKQCWKWTVERALLLQSSTKSIPKKRSFFITKLHRLIIKFCNVMAKRLPFGHST